MLMHFLAYVPYIQYISIYLNCLGLFWVFFFLPPLSLVYVNASMAPKRKFAPSRNPLRFRVSSSSNPTPSSIQFRDKDARKDFSENFSWRGVHSKHQVILSNFSDTDLPTVIHSRGWKSLCDVPVTCPSVLIQVFYSNMHGLDSSVPLFHTLVRDMHIVFTQELVFDVLCVPRVEHLDYPGCKSLRTVYKDEMIFAFY